MNLSFKKIWEQLKTGEDIDLFFYLIAALILSVVSYLGYTPKDQGFTFLAAGIASIIISIFTVRYISEKILERVEEFAEIVKNDSQKYTVKWPETLSHDMAKAEYLCFYGIHLHDTIDMYYDLIEKKAQEKKIIKFLFSDPKGKVWDMVRLRYNDDVGADISMINASITLIKNLSEKYPAQIEIRCIDYLFPRTAYIINPDRGDGCIYISNHTFRMGNEKTKQLFKKSEQSKWFNLYYKEFCKMWDSTPQIKNEN